MQIVNQLDPESKIKILKGMVIALSGALAVFALLLAFGIGVDKATLTMFVAWAIPVATNAYHQYLKGDPDKDETGLF